MLLENKVAVIYGAGGSIGGAVARTFAREGARVFLAGRTQAKLDKFAEEIRSNGGRADTAVVEALDERAVDEFVDAVVEQAGSIDISFNLIGYGDVQKPLLEISVEDFLQPIKNAMRAQFLTGRAAARHMVKRGSGVILAWVASKLPSTPSRGCLRTPQEYGGQDIYSTWTYTKIVPHERIECVFNFSDKDGHKLTPAQTGLEAGIPEDDRHVITFKNLGHPSTRLRAGRTEMTMTEHGCTTDQAHDISKAGLEQCLDKMAERVERGSRHAGS